MRPITISVITPSFNQAAYLEKTIRSVLDQDWPYAELIVIDGGSSDGSSEIIRSYSHRLAYWVSEPDRGQAHAINKGLAQAKGDLLAYLNSDDYYLPGTLRAVAEYASSNPAIDLIHGSCRYVDEHGNNFGSQSALITSYCEAIDLWGTWWKGRQFVQPEVFWTRRAYEAIGLFREELHYAMDYEYWLRILRVGGMVGRLDREIACFRFTPNQKSCHATAVADELRGIVGRELWDPKSPLGSAQRVRLQAKWLYDCSFRRTADMAVAKSFPNWRRWASLLGIVSRHPKLLLAPGFVARMTSPLRAHR